MFDLVLATIGTAITKTVLNLWLDDNELVYATSNSLYTIINSKIQNNLEARKLKRRFEDIQDKLTENLITNLQFYQNEDTNIDMLVKEIEETILSSRIDGKLLANLSYNPKKVYQHLINCRKINKKMFSSDEIYTYERMLVISSQFIIDLAPTMPNYQKDNFEEILYRFDEFYTVALKILNSMNTLLDTSSNAMEKKYMAFEHDYRTEIARKYDKLEVIGAELSKRYSRYKLSVAYVSLDMDEYKFNDGINEEYEVKVSSRVPVIGAFIKGNYFIITGEAGSGKSTLIKWLAVKSALKELEMELRDWGTTIPILIQLRNFPKGIPSIKKVIEEIAESIAMEVPKGWIEKIIKSGKVLLLVDGLDEVENTKRIEVYKWLEGLIYRYNMKIILTTRPGVEECNDYIYDFEFKPYSISSMTFKSISKFIEHWHRAVLGEKCDKIKELSSVLFSKIKNNSSVYKLASNPLMCALICALHHDRNMMLPVNRTSLYEECTRMLLERRDSDRGIISKEYSNLSYKQKRVLLDHIAYWMLKNNLALANKIEVSKVIEKKLDTINIDKPIDANTLLQFIIERSGLIREVEIGKVDFIHKTFQEYMAASSAVRELDWGLLYEKRENDFWNQTIILSVNFANQEDTDVFILKLLNCEKNSVRSKLLAFQCLETANEIAKKTKEEVIKEINKIIPPHGDNEVKGLVSAGDIAVPILEYKVEYEEKEIKNCINVLGQIASESALRMLETYINNKLNESLIDRLHIALSNFDFEAIYDTNISQYFIEYLESIMSQENLILNWDLINTIYKINSKKLVKALSRSAKNLKIKYINEKCLCILEKITGVVELDIEGEFTAEIFKKISKYKNLVYLKLTLYDDFNIRFLNLQKNKELKVIELILREDYYDSLEIRDLNYIDSLEQLKITSESGFGIDENTMIQISELKNIKCLNITSDANLYLEFIDGGEWLMNLEIVELSTTQILSIQSLADVLGIPNLKKLILNVKNKNGNLDEFIETARMMTPNLEIETNLVEKFNKS